MTHRETTWAGAVVLCLAAVLGCQDTTPTTGSSAPQSEGGEQAAIPGDLDLVILNGRVMDPETELDAIRNVGIKDGKIVVVTEQAIEGSETIDAKDIGKLANLPTRDEAISLLMAVMQAQVIKLSRTLNEVPGKLVRTVEAVRLSKEA